MLKRTSSISHITDTSDTDKKPKIESATPPEPRLEASLWYVMPIDVQRDFFEHCIECDFGHRFCQVLLNLRRLNRFHRYAIDQFSLNYLEKAHSSPNFRSKGFVDILSSGPSTLSLSDFKRKTNQPALMLYLFAKRYLGDANDPQLSEACNIYIKSFDLFYSLP